MPSFDDQLEFVVTLLPTPRADDPDVVALSRGDMLGFIALFSDRECSLDSPYVTVTRSTVEAIPGAPAWYSAQLVVLPCKVHIPYWLYALSFYLGDDRLLSMAADYEARFHLSVERLLRDRGEHALPANECIEKYRPYVGRK